MEFQNIYRKIFMIDDYSFSEQSSLFIIPSGLNTIIHYSEPFYSHYSKFIIHLPPPIITGNVLRSVNDIPIAALNREYRYTEDCYTRILSHTLIPLTFAVQTERR